MDSSKYYLFYDGECGFCNYWVKWILKRDKKDKFLFSSLQSEFGQKFLKERNLPTSDFTTIYLWKPKDFYLTKAQAAFKVASIIGGKYKVLVLAKYLPDFLTNFIYETISKNRKKLKGSSCELPTSSEMKKFVS